MSERRFPLEKETLLASVVEVLKGQGAAREIALLVGADIALDEVDYDNWNGGTSTWQLSLKLDLRVHGAMSPEERDDAERCIGRAAATFFAPYENDRFDGVSMVVRPVKNDRWREDAKDWLGGVGMSNQGRVRSDNIASRECDGLLFRSQAEIHLFRALKRLGLTFAPLPVFVRGGESYARLEPDFVVLKDGVLMVVEVDGDTYHHETPAQAHARLQPLDHEGAKIERVRAEDCATPEKARECADRLLVVLNKRIAQRA